MKRLVSLLIVVVSSAIFAQPVYKCGNSYSHEPCLGADEVPITMTEGVDSLSGQKRVSTEIAIDQIFRSDKTLFFGTDLRPTHGVWRDRVRRSKNGLTDSQIRECAKLRERILRTADAAKNTTPENRGRIEKTLFELRKKYRLDGC